MEQPYDLQTKLHAHHIEEADPGSVSNAGVGEWVEPPSHVTRAIVRKLDWRILPVMSLLYLFSFLDRTNIGNAKIDGLTEDLKLTSLEYNLCLTVFFFTYAVFEVPSNLCLKKYGARKWIPFIMFVWGVIMTLMGLVHNYEGLLSARLFLGLAEAGLFPGVTFYLTNVRYKREEQSLRIGIFFSAATIAGGFGGLLAYGIGKMDGVGGWEGWRWIFALEGLATVALAIAAYWMIIDSPRTAKFLTEEEATIVENRVKYDGSAGTPMSDHYEWKFVVQALTDWKVWLSLLTYYGTMTPLYCIALFLPSIIRGLGYPTTTSQLLTVPVYVAGCLGVLIFCYFSDKYRMRSPFIVLGAVLNLIGWGVAYGSNNIHVRYFAMFLATIGSYAGIVSVVAILPSNIGGQTKRATAIGMQIGIGGLSGCISSNIFYAKDAPNYRPALLIALGLSALALVNACLYWFCLLQANKNKLKQQREIAEGRLSFTEKELADMGDRNPYFMYTI
ncbi:major facilitator superfamily transporter [Saitoella complicata NRRL Y-17804]|uniref:major facilitator superfamily transporter n=1 Tax=Saitoella complicata (strain BCRC 22490 / CBS 7301 / JCM 7358 / NBRC 10748 / NRRL Y-17804) TaxID=698492 RepID=UPI00086695F4|nr:major facilitator superfamily transporter [Saitoella complicata NRRL Y-17804]ODQ54419.1 major facilitator superfamily transporter [Saitoella complicata NRRL Y-17804]